MQQILLFSGEKHLHNLVKGGFFQKVRFIFYISKQIALSEKKPPLGPTRLLISEIFPLKPDFYLYKCEKTLPTQPY